MINKYTVEISMPDDDYTFRAEFTNLRKSIEFGCGHAGCIVKTYKNGELISERLGRKKRVGRGD